MKHPARILVLGASGRLGAMLQRHWNDAMLHPVWQYRAALRDPVRTGEALIFDPLDGPPIHDPVDLVLGLAGTVPGKGKLSLNTQLALAAVNCASALGARHVMLSSTAAVYGASTAPLGEGDTPCPCSAYGLAKLEMEDRALALAARNRVAATVLRIGNVAGADALLGQMGTRRILDRFDSGHGPVRSYIGPHAMSTVLQALIRRACVGAPLPERLNLALQGGVAMADLCLAAGLKVAWQPAPAAALETVVLDVRRLAQLVPVPDADARAIVADWKADMNMSRGRGRRAK